MVQKSLSILVSIEYDAIFDKPRPTWETLFEGIPTTTIIELVGGLNARIYLHERELDKQRELIAFVLQRQSSDLKTRFADRMGQILLEKNQFSFISNQSSTILIERALEFYTPGDARDLTIEEEERFVKAYLLATQEWVDEENIEPTQELNTPQALLEFVLPHFLPFEDIKKYRDFRWQIYKAVEFFTYIEQHQELKEFLPPFLARHSVHAWQEYVYQILNCFLTLYQPGTRDVNGAKLTTPVDDPINSFLDSLSILDPSSYQIKPDFISLREKPIYKSDTNTYIAYNYSFLIDKLFQTIVFDFGLNLTEFGIVKDIPDFKSKYFSEPFYEQYLLYRLCRYMIGKRKKCVAFDGLEWEKKSGEKGPDFYIRCGSKIFLIEFKDAIFQAKAKLSRNYEVIKNEIFSKLKTNKKGKQKGISQLAILSNKLVTEGINFDSFDQNIQIYPILIITDEIYNTYGINYLLNSEYQSLLEEQTKYCSQKLLVIHIDTLIEMQDIIHDRQLPIQDCFTWYFDYINNPINPHDQFLSFSRFIIRELEIRRKKLEDLPRTFKKIVPSITELIDGK